MTCENKTMMEITENTVYYYAGEEKRVWYIYTVSTYARYPKNIMLTVIHHNIPIHGQSKDQCYKTN